MAYGSIVPYCFALSWQSITVVIWSDIEAVGGLPIEIFPADQWSFRPQLA